MSGFSRVSIPPSLRKTIHDIKEITGKHSDEDVYAMLKECNMDPNETAQRLLYLDTFHEVKRKRDTRKVQNSNNRQLEENRRISGMQKRGTRVGNYYSYNSDGVGGKQSKGLKQNDYSKATQRDSKSFVTASLKEKNTPVVASSAAPAEDLTSTGHGKYNHESSFALIEDNMRGLIEDANDGYNNESRKLALRPLIQQKQLSMLYPGPTPKARIQGGNLKGNPSCLGDSVASPTLSDLHSSASDPVDIIKDEAENQQKIAEISANLLADRRTDAAQTVTSGQVVSGSVNLTTNSLPIEYQGVERSREAESSALPSSTSCHIAAGTGNQDTCSVQQANDSLKGVVLDGNPYSHPTLEGLSERTTSEIEDKPHKLHISDGQPVIFPKHLHVPEALKKALIFGSLDVPAQFNNEDSKPKDVSAPTNFEATKEPSPTRQSPSPPPGGNGCPGRVQSSAQVMMNLTASKENSSSGSRVVKLDEHELQIPSKASATPSMAQLRGFAQRSIAVPPPLFPLLRQPYPPNYIPYSPYFSQLYMPPQNAHQLLTHSGFPQQPSPGNIYIPPTATATSGVKFPIYKPGAHFGISSCYGAFGAPGPSYGPPGPNGNNGVARSELKDKDMYSTVTQNEDLHALNSVLGRDIPALQPNVFYNLPQGQPVPAFSPAQVGHNSIPGIYHPSQSISTRSLQSLQQQPPSQPTAGAVEPFLVVGHSHTRGC